MLSQWILETESANIRMSYTCISPIPAMECESKMSENWLVGHEIGPIGVLDTAAGGPSCSNSQVLQGWNLAMSDPSHYHLEWTCCSLGHGFSQLPTKINMGSVDGSLSNLEQQEVSCKNVRGSDSPLNGFEYDSQVMAYSYNCAISRSNPSKSMSLSTQFYEGGHYGLIYLHAHSVQCPANSVISDFQLESTPDDIRYRYECLQYDDSEISCRFGYTAFSDPGPVGSLVQLDKHAVRCNPNEVLAGFKLEANDMGDVRYEFSCCTQQVAIVVAPTLEPTLSPVSVPTFEPTFKPSFRPTFDPSAEPIALPTLIPTLAPTNSPVSFPTFEPTTKPSDSPTVEPTRNPRPFPTQEPSLEPTLSPVSRPSREPTMEVRF